MNLKNNEIMDIYGFLTFNCIKIMVKIIVNFVEMKEFMVKSFFLFQHVYQNDYKK